MGLQVQKNYDQTVHGIARKFTGNSPSKSIVLISHVTQIWCDNFCVCAERKTTVCCIKPVHTRMLNAKNWSWFRSNR